MKFLVFGSVIYVLLVTGGALPRAYSDDDKQDPETKNKEGWAVCIQDDVDAYLDKVLEKVRETIPEPMRLPPRRVFVDLSEGRIWGMKEIVRAGPVKVKCENNDQTAVITGELTTDELKARYNWEKELASKKHSGLVLVISHDFTAEFRLVIQKSEKHPKLEEFKIRRFKDVKVEMTGMGFLSWAIGEITTMMSGVLEWAMKKSIQGPLEEAIQRELWEITLS